MRKAICVLAVVCLAATLSFGAAGDLNQSYVTQENAYGDWVALASQTNGGTLNVGRALPSVHTIQWITAGGPATCTLQMQGSIDGSNWFSIGSAQTCTSTGSYSFAGAVVQSIRPNLTALTGGTAPTVQVFYAGSHSGAGAAGSGASGASAGQVQGTAASGAALSGNPVRVGISDGTNAQDMIQAVQTLNSTGGGIPAVGLVCNFDDASVQAVTENQFAMVRCEQNRRLLGATTYGVANLADGLTNNAVVPYCGASGGCQATGLNNGIGFAVGTLTFNGSGWDKQRSADLTNYNIATSTTAVNSIGAELVEKGSRWSVIHNPAANSQATASIASEASVRHVVDCVSFSAVAAVAPALTALTVNVRDGASGAGTIIWTYQVIIPAATGQSVAPHSICGLNLVGTTATAMTLEFSAGLTSLVESVSISGFNVN